MDSEPLQALQPSYITSPPTSLGSRLHVELFVYRDISLVNQARGLWRDGGGRIMVYM